jgi:Phage uncharacterised protein (Phage_XkdX)
MNWFLLAQRDYEIYQDPIRIKGFVQKLKITETQYQEITGEIYVI